MFNSNVLIKVNPFQNGKTDKNGKDPVILQVVAGKCPNRMVIAGTVAERAGFEIGETYLANVRETEPSDEYGRQFRWSVIAPVSGAIEVLDIQERLGEPVVFDVENASFTQEEATQEAPAKQTTGEQAI